MSANSPKDPLKVFLGNAPWLKPGYYGVRAGSRWPHFERQGDLYMPFPFYLAYTTAILEKENVPCKLVDGVAERISLDDFHQRMNDFQPDVVVLEVSTPSMELDLKIAGKVKKELPQSTVVFAGPNVEMYEAAFLENAPHTDVCAIGEYDYTIRDLVRALSEGRDLSTVQGIVYRDSEGKPATTGRRPLIENLDELPWPARHHLPMMNYHDVPGGIPCPSLQMWASRGCPYQCIFCAWPQIMYGGSKYRVRDPKDVVAEIAWCKKEYGFKSFYFDDDTFNIGKQRIMKLCEHIRAAGLNMPWAVMARADQADREMLQAMKDAGLWSIKYGVESGSQALVDACRKKLDLAKVEETVRITRELGLNFHLTFTFGLPGENWDTVHQTIRFAKRMSPDTLQFSIVTPFPGSSYFGELDKKGYLLTKDWNKYDGYNTAVIRTDQMTARDLEKALRMAERSWERQKLLRALFRKDKWAYAWNNPRWAFYNVRKAFGLDS